MFDRETINIIKRLQLARLALMKTQPFYAVLLLHMQFSIDPTCETAYTDGERIVFCPDFINSISDTELQFVLMHEVMHAALNHAKRMPKNFDYDCYNTACDIVVNSNILYSCNMNTAAITLKNYGESMHLAPNGKEGYLYSLEEVYSAVYAAKVEEEKDKKKQEKLKKRLKSKYEDFSEDSGNPKDKEESSASPRSDGGFDDHSFWGQQEDTDGSGDSADYMENVWLHRMVEATDICGKILSVKKSGNNCGLVPMLAERLVGEFKNPQTDWRTVLDTFIQEEINDYSFSPPDRRFQDSPFLLPDYNEKDEVLKNLLFFIDTSGSMSDEMITQAYTEIKGGIDQFNGKLSGWLGFFDAQIVEPKEFCSEDELKIIRPQGGGGTNFQIIFDYVKKAVEKGMDISSIIILTDGYCEFPNESEAMGIPVLWIINNEKITPPWGKLARIKADGDDDMLNHHL